MTDFGPMQRATGFALKSIPDVPRESVTRALIREYARILDDSIGTETEAKTFTDIGPKLLAALVAMGMTRGNVGGGDNRGNAVNNTLDDLRARRERRARPDGA